MQCEDGSTRTNQAVRVVKMSEGPAFLSANLILFYFLMFTPSKTLVIRFSSIGDIVLSTPLLRVLRARFPKTQIDYVTKKEYAELIHSNHNINFTYQYDPGTGFQGLRELKRRLKAGAYDLVVDIHNSLRSRYVRSMLGVEKIAVIDKRIKERTMLVKFKKNIYGETVPVSDRYVEALKEFDVRSDGKGPELHIPDEVLFGVSGRVARLRLNRFEKVLGICPFARHATKEWPLDRYAGLAVGFVRGSDGAVMIFGGKEDRKRSEALTEKIASETGRERIIDWTGECSLLETAAAMQYCDVIATNDTGLMHLANAMNKKVVAVFGSTVREFGFFPHGKESVVLERRDLYCRPCSHVGLPECPESHFRCMREIEVEEVAAAVKSFVTNS